MLTNLVETPIGQKLIADNRKAKQNKQNRDNKNVVKSIPKKMVCTSRFDSSRNIDNM